MSSHVLFVSIHMGPFLTLAPLVSEFGGGTVLLVEGAAAEASERAGLPYWTRERVTRELGSLERFFQENLIRAVICGTSDGLSDGNLEEAVQVSATKLGLPLFAIEDYPGNYRPYAGARLNGLVIEHRGLEALYRGRGIDSRLLFPLGNPRYDHLHTLDRHAIRERTRSALGLGGGPVVLWAGQPDGYNSFNTLRQVVPELMKHRAALLFKAHPRDDLYRDSQVYQTLLSRMPSCFDVTSKTDTIPLCCAADLVLTQFSSVGVEGSHLGTPAMYLLFDDLGKASLRRLKGYDCPPWAKAGGAFVVDSFSDLTIEIDRALWDEDARGNVGKRFAEEFGFEQASAPAIAAMVRGHLKGSPR